MSNLVMIVRKEKGLHTKQKANITAFPTPTGPFQVWEVDLYGPLPISLKGNVYVFTAADMFSKFTFGRPLANKDALSVSNALFHLFTSFGVCSTLISDQGTEVTAKVTREVCKMLGVEQQFTPSFMHHCLGALERKHAPLAEKLTTFMHSDCKNWEDMLPAIVFAMNSSVNSSVGYSPFEIVYGQRPKFPLAEIIPHSELQTLPKDMKTYLLNHNRKLITIREHLKQNALKSQDKMLSVSNKDNTDTVKFEKGDFVYLSEQPTRPAQKLQFRYSGPYIIHEIPSSHMVLLQNPTTKQCFKNPVHINRIKQACVRQPEPSPFFKVIKSVNDRKTLNKCSQTDHTQTQNDHIQPSDKKNTETTSKTYGTKPRKSQRNIKKPIRYRNSDHVNPFDMSSLDLTVSSDSDGFHKIKRILAKKNENDTVNYLVQIRGEPAENAIWVPYSNLKAKAAIKKRPPNI